MSKAGFSWTPTFIDGAEGRLFAIFFEPTEPTDEAVLIVQPFAEEMNRSRRTLSLQARALASRGLGVLLLDLFGTGDSGGCFSSARWEVWRDDVAVGLTWLRDRGFQGLTVLAVRLGACLALDSLSTGAPPTSRLVLWQPILTGQSYIKQILRIRVAAQLNEPSPATREDTQALMARLEAGETIEIAGYPISPELAGSIRGLRIEDLEKRCPPMRIDWLEVAGPERMKARTAAARIIDGWQSSGRDVSLKVVEGQAFWDIEQIDRLPAVIGATAELW